MKFSIDRAKTGKWKGKYVVVVSYFRTRHEKWNTKEARWEAGSINAWRWHAASYEKNRLWRPEEERDALVAR